jgi:hypothetical protein
MPTADIQFLTYAELGSPVAGGTHDVPGRGPISIDSSDLDIWKEVGFVGAAQVQLRNVPGSNIIRGEVTRIVG